MEGKAPVWTVSISPRPGASVMVGAPVTDWQLYDTAYTERYLGLPSDGSDVYAHHSVLELAAGQPAGPDDARPMLLIHGLVVDNVVAAHTLRLSAALLASGRLGQEQVLAALLAYRALYYFGPLVLAALAFGVAELHWRRQSPVPADRAAAD